MKTTTSPAMQRYNYLFGETNAVYHLAALKLGLSDSVMQLLYTLCDFGGACLLADIPRMTGLTKQTVNSALRHMEQDGLVCLEPVNSKAKRVKLTEQGARLADQTIARLMDAENQSFAAWKPEEVTQFLALTERFLNELKEKVKGF